MRYIPRKVIEAIKEKLNGKRFPRCRVCGKKQFVLAEKVCRITVSDEVDGEVNEETLPASAIICAKCGHIDLFSVKMLEREDK